MRAKASSAPVGCPRHSAWMSACAPSSNGARSRPPPSSGGAALCALGRSRHAVSDPREVHDHVAGARIAARDRDRVAAERDEAAGARLERVVVGRDLDRVAEHRVLERGALVARERTRLALPRDRQGVARGERLRASVAEVADLSKSPNWSFQQLYDFACVYSVASNKIADKKKEYADRAMDLLQQAVKAGWKNAVHMKNDPDLDALREREDFRKLVAALEAKVTTPVSSPDVRGSSP